MVFGAANTSHSIHRAGIGFDSKNFHWIRFKELALDLVQRAGIGFDSKSWYWIWAAKK